MSTVNPDTPAYVNWFRHSSPYINRHRGDTFVIFFGGEAVAHTNFSNIIHDIALLNSLGIRLVLVHGARLQIRNHLNRQGLTEEFVDNYRVTSKETLSLIQQAVGEVRIQLESLLSMGLPNSPMHDAHICVSSGNFISAKPFGVLNGVDLQYSGQVRKVDTANINKLLDLNQIVLLTPIGYSVTGESFNIQAEDVAMETAIALQADKLIMLEKDGGILDENGRILREIPVSKVDHLITHKPQINRLVKASRSGVKRCHVLSYEQDGGLLQELFTRDGVGTMLTKDRYEQIRTASIDDVGGILGLIEPLEQEGLLVRRSREMLETEISQFIVIERDGVIIGCAGLYPVTDSNWAEVACVAVHADYRNEKRGELLLTTLIEHAKKQALKTLFVLTTQTAHWFQELGFEPVTVETLPAPRQSLYNWKRNSKIFTKSI